MTPGLPRLDGMERALVALFLLTLPLVNPYLRGEGNGHYAYLASAVLDGDLRFENEYGRGDPDFLTSTFRRADGHLWPPMELPNGHVRNAWTIGPALLWLPGFLEAHGVALALRWWGADIAADGYGLPYRLACAVSTATLSFIGLLLVYRVAASLAGTAAALAATLAVWGGSSLAVYMYFLPFYPHALAAFTASLFLWFWRTRAEARTGTEWTVWGLLGGLTFETEHRTAALLLLPVVEWLRASRGGASAVSPASRLKHAAGFLAGALAGALPGIVARSVLYGTPLRTGNLNLHFWDAPWWWSVGVSPEHGLFSWTPVTLLALLGLIVLCRREPWIGGPLLAVWLVFHYAVASYRAWHGGSSYGNRFFIALTPVFVIGLAVLLKKGHGAIALVLRPRRAWWAVAAPLAVLVAWNLGLIFQWGAGLVPRQGPVDFGLVARNQVSAVPRRIAHFALRYLAARNAVVREQEQSEH